MRLGVIGIGQAGGRVADLADYNRRFNQNVIPVALACQPIREGGLLLTNVLNE